MTPVTQLRTRRLRQLKLDTELGRRTGTESAARARRTRAECTDGTRLTLAQSLSSAWEGLQAVGAADCVICGAEMVRLKDGTGACGGCGTTMA